ncbi:MAG: aldo/keto reductase [Planctomycetota bacterium]|jgi:aryl-alcohol dehydrogenase-like predicted oxidoreductase
MKPEPDASATVVPRTVLADGYSISRIINGCWQLSMGHRPAAVDRAAAVDELLRLVDAGLTTFDCGDIYVGVESLLGEVIRAERARHGGASRLQVHTKLVPDLDALPRLRRADVERTVDRSLRRLGVERLDLVQLHWWDDAIRGYVEAAGWLADLQRAGKIRLLGATNFDVPRLREIVEAGIPVAAHQVQYSLLDARPERGMVGFCREHDIHLLAYGTLAGGFLTDRYLGRPAPEPPLPNRSLVKYRLMIDELGGWDRLQVILRAADRVARRRGVEVANVAVRAVLDRPGVAAVIVGAAGARHLAATLRSAALELTADDQAELRAAVGPVDGPPGDVYAVERIRQGPHGAIMRYDLNREQDDADR